MDLQLTLNNYNKKPRPFQKKDLIEINNLKELFSAIRDYAAGNLTGITRDETIAQNLIRLLFIKIYDESSKNKNCNFAFFENESLNELEIKINDLFEKVKKEYKSIFEPNEKIEIYSNNLAFIVCALQDYSITNSERDIIADAFEELIGRSFRGGEGQFFTPQNVVNMMVDVLQIKEGEKIIDPACGSGGFLVSVLKKNKSVNIDGIDKDNYLAKICNTYLTILGGKNHSIFCENSLEIQDNWSKDTQKVIKDNKYDVVITNPPFGAKIPIVGEEILTSYQLGHYWKQKKDGWEILNKVRDKQPPQILFIEKCLNLLKEGGRMGIVLPEGIFGNPSDRYIWEYLNSVSDIFGIVSLNQETFQPSTHTKTSVLFLRKRNVSKKKIFMSICKEIGHNKNGKTIYKKDLGGNLILDNKGKEIIADDLPDITNKFLKFNNNNKIEDSSSGFTVEKKNIKNYIYIPEYYDPAINNLVKNNNKFKFVSMGELLDKGLVKISRGNEIGSENYGTGEIPFVRTTDLVNWEIKINPIKGVSEEIYNNYKNKQDIKKGDILFVSDGTFLIGRSSYVTELDTKILIQSHVKKIRSLSEQELNSYYLFYLLNTNIVRKQILSKTFVQATISTLGERLYEVKLPFFRNQEDELKVIKATKKIMDQKMKSKKDTLKLINESK